MKKKIMICGASGSGKTTLAKYISETYGIEYLNSSASKIWPKYGFIDHADSITQSIIDPDKGLQYQMDILEQRNEILSNHESYITDRSYIDMIVYIMSEIGYLFPTEVIDNIIDRCREATNGVDMIFYISWNNNVVLENNGKRIINYHYQSMINSIFKWVIKELDVVPSNVPIHIIDSWDLEIRKKLVNIWLK